jgi:N-dimethylarginine dimethylaminohydrolase
MTERYMSHNIEHLKKQLEAEKTSLERLKLQVLHSENVVNHLNKMIYTICNSINATTANTAAITATTATTATANK